MCIRSSKANGLSQNHHLAHRPVVNEGFLKKVAQKILMSCFINWKMPDTRLSVESIFL